MQVLVDTSTWIDYFKIGSNSKNIDLLIDNNIIVTNDIILAELIPFLKVKKQSDIIRLLKDIAKIPLQVDWEEVIQYQIKCLRSGINGIGIPDLLIVQNIKQNNCLIYSLDKHFVLLQKIVGIKIFNETDQ